jgi:hypothetical protein
VNVIVVVTVVVHINTYLHICQISIRTGIRILFIFGVGKNMCSILLWFLRLNGLP